MKIINKVNGAIFAGSVYLSLALPAFAQVNIDPCEGPGTSNNLRTELCAITAEGAGPFIRNLVVAILIIIAVVALFFLIWGGFKWLTSGGDKAKVDAARQTIIAAIIGLVLAFLAYFILQFVMNLFGVGLEDLTIPELTGDGGAGSGGGRRRGEGPEPF